MGICQTTKEKIESLKKSVTDEDYDTFKDKYENLLEHEKKTLESNFLNEDYLKLRKRFEEEKHREKMQSRRLSVILHVMVLIPLLVFLWVGREYFFEFLVVLKTDPMDYLNKLPFPNSIDDPLLSVQDAEYVHNFLNNDFYLYGTFVSYFYHNFSKDLEMKKFGVECTLANQIDYYYNFTVEMMLLKKDYYFKLSNFRRDRDFPYTMHSEIAEITKYLDIMSSCFLTTRNKRYRDVLKNFTESKEDTIRDKAKEYIKKFPICEKPLVFHEISPGRMNPNVFHETKISEEEEEPTEVCIETDDEKIKCVVFE